MNQQRYETSGETENKYFSGGWLRYLTFDCKFNPTIKCLLNGHPQGGGFFNAYPLKNSTAKKRTKDTKFFPADKKMLKKPYFCHV